MVRMKYLFGISIVALMVLVGCGQQAAAIATWETRLTQNVRLHSIWFGRAFRAHSARACARRLHERSRTSLADICRALTRTIPLTFDRPHLHNHAAYLS